MKKANYNKTGTRQIIESGWKLFDKQTNYISTGNCISNTQLSSFIRPWKETECNGFTNPQGELMNYDLQQYNNFNIPPHIEKIIQNKERTESVILYMFFVYKCNRVKPFGWVLTTRNHDYITSCVTHNYGESYLKRSNALTEAMSYITN